MLYPKCIGVSGQANDIPGQGKITLHFDDGTQETRESVPLNIGQLRELAKRPENAFEILNLSRRAVG